jgi:hypothetical protein
MRKLLVTRLRFMGDVILTTPLLQSIREKYPAARITYLTEAAFAPLLSDHPAVDEVLILHKNFYKQIRLIFRLLRTRFDVAIDLFGNPRSALLTWLSGAKMRIGGNFRGRRYFYTHRIRGGNEKMNAIQYHLRYGRPLGISSRIHDPVIAVPEDQKAWAAAHLKELGYTLTRPVIGLHVGASWPAKKWFPERFAELAGLIQKELNADVYFTTGPGDAAVPRMFRRFSRFADWRLCSHNWMCLSPMTAAPCISLLRSVRQPSAFSDRVNPKSGFPIPPTKDTAFFITNWIVAAAIRISAINWIVCAAFRSGMFSKLSNPH